MSRFRRVPANALHAEPWANGSGTTTVLASGPDPQDWQWQLSIAQIDRDADFSSLPGVRRQFASLDAPLTLHFPDGQDRRLLRLGIARFDGSISPRAELTEGPTRAFNMMLRGDVEGELVVRPLNGAMVLPVSADSHWFVHLLAGRAEIHAGDEATELAQSESLWIDADAGDRLRIDGGGEIVLVRLDVHHAG
ncbi:HutD/Ves family protein [Dyella subtropica]|uniref:HutD/Ves family protein n=1 Tax=Dyella subtropica TaxID=2992127 RepID=UPI002254B008|nr:HutD family protein [Dyella subtropica]